MADSPLTMVRGVSRPGSATADVVRRPTRVLTSRAREDVSVGQRRQDILLVEAEESLLIWTDLMHPHAVIAGLSELVHRVEVSRRARPGRGAFGQILWADRLDRILEVARPGQLARQLAGKRSIRPQTMRGLEAVLLGRRHANVQHPVLRLPPAAPRFEALDHVAIGRRVH